MNTILIVDDEPAIRRLGRLALEQNGLCVLEAGDGVAAIEAAKEHVPDAIVLDLTLPRMRGLDVWRKLQAEAATASIPILLISGFVDSATLDTTVNNRAIQILEKPFTPRQLVLAVTRLLRKEAAPAPR